MTGSSPEPGTDWEENFEDRVANCLDSILWTYKAHFQAADSYRSLGTRLDWVTTLGAAVLTTGLIWSFFPDTALVALAIGVAVVSGYKTAKEPARKADSHYRAAEAYHGLFDEFLHFAQIDMEQSSNYEELFDEFEELAERRRNLNEHMPQLQSKWYKELDDSIYDEVETTDEAKEQLLGRG